MDQASASPEASCAHNPVAPRTSSSCSRSVDRSRTGGPPHARPGPQCEPHAAPSNRDSRPSSPAPCRLKPQGYPLPEFYSAATGRSGRFNEGLLLRRLHEFSPDGIQCELKRLYYDTANATSAPTIALMKLVPPSQITYGSDFPYFPLDHDGGPVALVVV